MALSLYAFETCPYCRRVRAAIDDLELAIEIRDTQVDPAHRKALIAATGSATVPVLRIEGEEGLEDQYLPESADIVAFLYAQYGDGRTPPRMDLFVVQRIATAVMWALLIGGMFVPEYQPPLWTVACAIGAVRSIYNGVRTRSPMHYAIGAVFALASVAVVLRALGISDLPWWYVMYALVGTLLVATLVLRMRSKRE